MPRTAPDETGDLLWSPGPPDETTVMGTYLAWLDREKGLRFSSYDDLWAWSVDDIAAFWGTLAEFLDVDFHEPPEAVVDPPTMPGAVWFRGARLNYAERALHEGDEVAIVGHSQTRGPVQLTRDELRDAVARIRQGLVALGVGRGDTVAAYMPNIPETVAAFLATASLGAVWASCAPEFGTKSVLDRLRQIGPKVLLAVDGYRYGDRDFDRMGDVQEMRAALSTVETVVVLPYLDPDRAIPADAVAWSTLVERSGPLEFASVPFDHPLYVLFSSGTTGLPKPIVHGHGGMVLEHLKWLHVHLDVRDGERFFQVTTTAWMAWNLAVSALLTGASIVTFDGNPLHPDLGYLWRLVSEADVQHFSASAPYLVACRKNGIVPKAEGDLSRLRSLTSSGAPLPTPAFRWIYENVRSDILLSSASGGTDVCSAFVGMNPLVPVYAGEISRPFLGARVEAYDESGKPVVGQQGELVLTVPMPSMPVRFWNDPRNERYHSTYFERFPGVWAHGDWITFTERGTCIITGRSDATLNRGGVRLGTSEFYSVVEEIDGVADSLVVHLEDPEGGLGELLLFVVLSDGADLDAGLREEIESRLRTQLSPRHVPNQIIAIDVVPRNITGKKMEVPVKRLLTGALTETADAFHSIADADSLKPFVAMARAPAR
jgi:acetoacetyl-CoA synthetase